MREVDFLEACYRLDPDAEVWAARLCGIAEGFFPDDRGIALFAYEVQPGWEITSPWWVVTERGGAAAGGLGPDDLLPSVSPKTCGKHAIRSVYGAARPLPPPEILSAGSP